MENSSPNPSFSICDIRIQKQISRSFGKSFPPQKIVLPKLRPQCVPPPARILGGQNTKEKCPFLFQEKFHHHIGEARNIFLWCCRMKRGSGGTIHSTSGFCSKCVRISSYRGSPVGQEGTRVSFCVFMEPFIAVLKLKNVPYFISLSKPFFLVWDRIRTL